MYHFCNFSKEDIMKRTNLTVKQVGVIAIAVIFISALVYVSFYNVETVETIAEQPIPVKVD
jgi:hypothetical protein